MQQSIPYQSWLNHRQSSIENRPSKMLLLSCALLLLALIPALVFLSNLRLYRPPADEGDCSTSVSVLIPARNEERSIRSAVESVLASEGVGFEVIVLDDASEDATASIVEAIIERDHRVRLVSAPPLPEGWCGKQHACWILSKEAKSDLLLFMDADCQLTPDGLRRMVTFLDSSNASLVSGVPQQETGGLLEKLLIPLIHFILLGFLPIRRMRQSTHPSYAAGCGQIFLARKDAYEKAGGHEAIRESRHDGLALPRVFREAGLMTDLFDATQTASCRMYHSSSECWNGLVKNSTEGLGSSKMILPITMLLMGGQVLPFLLLPVMLSQVWILAPACLFAWLPRWIGVVRFRQSWLGAMLHPFGVTLLITIQWHGLIRALLRRPSTWKGRSYQTS